MTARNSAGYDAPVGLAADPVVFTLVDGDLSVLLARRLEEPQRGTFALPGGFVGARGVAAGDGGAQAAREDRRRLGPPRAAADLRAAPTATRAAGCPRSPTSRSCRPESLPADGPSGREASWHRVDALPELALDHATIVDDALWRLRARLADKAWFVRVAGGLLDRAVHARPGPAALRGAARRAGRRRQLPPRRARHRACSRRPASATPRASAVPASSTGAARALGFPPGPRSSAG